MAEIKIGQEVGRYKIVERLGRGGMAEVYKGYQSSLDRYVAIKLMHAFLVSEQDFLARFQREAKAIARLNHPNIIGVYDFDTFGDDTYYLVMEYIGGGTLKDKLQELIAAGQQLTLDEAIRIVSEITSALAYAHKQGMIHRDIKPANIMLTESGKAVLTDFGIVKLVGGGSQASAAYTATGALIGTPAYMAPEQALGKPGDERSDIYSLGVMLFQMVTGKLPFDADTPLAVVMKHVNEPVPMPVSFNPDVPFRLQEVILRALEKEPDRRFQSANEMLAALRQAQMMGEATAVPYGASSFAESWTQAVNPQAYDTASGQHTLGPTAVFNPEANTTVAGATADISATGTGTLSQPAPSQRPRWLYPALGLLAILIIGGILFFTVWGGGDPAPTATASLLTIADDNSTGTPTPTETGPTSTATITLTPSQTPDIVASSVAAIAQTEEARPTETATPTSTPTPTPTQTPNATATFLAGCTTDVELVDAHPYQSNNSNTVPISVQFPMYWTLKNSGTCPWPTDLLWSYVEGADLARFPEPVELDLTTVVLPDEEIVINTSFVAPANVSTFESVWQLQDPDEEPFGSPITFTIRTYIPATATPVATNTPVVTASPTVSLAELNYIFEVVSCIYEGIDWSCHVRVIPFGGAGGPYTVFVFDQPAGQATRLQGSPPYDYFARARRCAAFNQNVRVIDDGVTPALEFNRHLYLDPGPHFEGGCQLP